MPRRISRKSSQHADSRSATAWERDVFALLSQTDAKRLQRAQGRLDASLKVGVRHFSSFAQVVALQDAPEAGRRFAAMERAQYVEDPEDSGLGAELR